MKMNIQTFAMLKEFFKQEFEIEIDNVSTVTELKHELIRMKPAATSLLNSCRVAANDELLNDLAELHDGTTIYLIPPSSGG